MNGQARLVEAFREMRTGDGVTLDKLDERDWMFPLLLVDNAEQARKKLAELIGTMGDGMVARSVRVALAIGAGIEAHIGVVKRRVQATATPEGGGRPYIERAPRTLSDYEDAIGFPALAKLILDRHAEVQAAKEREPDFFDLMTDPHFKQGFELAQDVVFRLDADKVVMTRRNLRFMQVNTIVLAFLMFFFGGMIMYGIIATYPNFFFHAVKKS
ncbi:hypothetical protein [Streptomyces pluripotens]|uniref:hypothetical protein n=1 Tax=Streptomyces pluripotens TaxID=1355015 RepID=UPI00131D3DE7|nr:hypothetical protein [Streptomyces pluripotens]